MGGLTAFEASPYGAETTNVKLYSVGIYKVMGMTASDIDTLPIMRDYLTADTTTESFFRQGNS